MPLFSLESPMGKKAEPLHAQISVLINASQLNSVLKLNRAIGKQTAELTGSLREKIAYAKDKHGLHPGAFAILKQLDRKEPEAALELWTHLLAYLDMSGIKAKMDSVTRLDFGEDEPGGKPSKVTSLAKRRRQADADTADLEAAE